MMFRKLYWVLETADAHGAYGVNGVYTSIPDLLRYGFANCRPAEVRLTLTKLDSSMPPLGRWSGPRFAGLAEALQEYVRTDEFSAEQCTNLVQALGAEQLITA